mgnify:CR=1 FL=1
MNKGVIGIILSEDKSQVLLIKRQDVPVWVLPGGGVEQDESSTNAVIREFWEETGLKVKIYRKIAEYSPVNRLASLAETYECIPYEGELQRGSETKAISYFPLDQLPKNFFFLHLEWLQDALKNQTDVIHQPLSHITYWNLFKYFIRHPYWVIRFLITKIIKD